MNDYTERSEDLKKLANFVREFAKKAEQEKRKKTASLLVAATGLTVLSEKLRS